jgi:hypothetical protein
MVLKVGKDIPAQDAAELLLKLIADGTRTGGLYRHQLSEASVIGFVYPAHRMALAVVKAYKKSGTPFPRFDPSAATSFRFADRRAFCENLVAKRRLTSALSFNYPDKTHVTLFELSLGEEEHQDSAATACNRRPRSSDYSPLRTSNGEV